MTKKDIAKQIASKYGIDQVIAKRAVQDVFDSIVDSLLHSGRMELRNFGVFEVKRRAPRVARNPRTNEQVSVPAKTVVVFQAGKKLAELASRLDGPPQKDEGEE
ncbi:MAG: integration host factor subunit beta [Phycisphaerae bacterium]|nr:integration host factor subunit beta [Phycisphaerae bacterium]